MDDKNSVFYQQTGIPKRSPQAPNVDNIEIDPVLQQEQAGKIAGTSALTQSVKPSKLPQPGQQIPLGAYAALGNIAGELTAGAINSLDTTTPKDTLIRQRKLEKAGASSALARTIRPGKEVTREVASGALKGAGIGAGLGSVVPGVGTAAGAVVGAGLGAISGGIRGKRLQKTATDNMQAQEQDIAAYSEANPALRLEKGGKIVGNGTGTSDSIKAEMNEGDFIVPAKNNDKAVALRKQMLPGTASQKSALKTGKVPVKVSNGEHRFTAEEVAYLTGKGVNLNKLAPEAKPSNKLAKGGTVTAESLRSEIAKKQLELEKQGALGGKGLLKDSPEVNKLEEELAKLDADLRKQLGSEAEGVAAKNRNLANDAVRYYTEKISSSANVADVQRYKKLLDEAKQSASGYETALKAASDQRRSGRLSAVDYQKVIDDQTKETTTLATKYTDALGGKDVAATEQAADATAKIAATPDYVLNLQKQVADQQGSADQPPITPAAVSNVRASAGTKKTATPTTTTVGAAATSPSSVIDVPVETKTQKVDPVIGQEAALTKTDMSAKPEQGIVQQGAAVGSEKKPASKYSTQDQLVIGLGAAQTALGVASGLSDKRPEDQIGSVLASRLTDASLSEQTGLSPSEQSRARTAIGTRFGTVARKSADISSTRGQAMANIRQAGFEANISDIAVEQANAAAKQAKKQRTDQLAGAVESRRRQIFQDKMNTFLQNQQASAQLTQAGISNVVGSLQNINDREEIERISKKYNLNLSPNVGQGAVTQYFG